MTPPEDILSAIRSMPPLTTPVVRTEPRLESGTFNIAPIALGSTRELCHGGMVARGLLRDPLPEIMDRLKAPPFGMTLPAPTSTITLEIDTSGDVRNLHITATGADGAGLVHTAPLEPLEQGAATYELQLDAAVRLLSITIHRTSLDTADELTFDISSIEADGEAPPPGMGPLDLARERRLGRG